MSLFPQGRRSCSRRSVSRWSQALEQRLLKSRQRSQKLQATKQSRLKAEKERQQERKTRLEEALTAKGLILRTDSWTCSQYIHGNLDDLDQWWRLCTRCPCCTVRPAVSQKNGKHTSPPVKEDIESAVSDWAYGRDQEDYDDDDDDRLSEDEYEDLKEQCREQMWKAYQSGQDMTQFDFS